MGHESQIQNRLNEAAASKNPKQKRKHSLSEKIIIWKKTMRMGQPQGKRNQEFDHFKGWSCDL